jgi:L-lactate dehydrogenase complex protein LldE
LSEHRKTSIFVTCLVDFLFPKVGQAMVRVLRHYGVQPEFPPDQTCCGQPAFNAGFREQAREVALHFLDVFEGSDAVVSPSGSCVAMVKEYYPELFSEDEKLKARFHDLGHRTWEFSQYLTDVLGVNDFPGHTNESITWHDCCHSLRALGIKEGPRKLLGSLKDVDIRELEKCEECCGFGGLFSVKFDEISSRMLERKLDCVEKSGADNLVATDCSCLMHMDGGLRNRGLKVQTRHLAEVLADALDADTENNNTGPAS